MNCPMCSEKMRGVRGRHQYVECGLNNVWIENCSFLECKKGHYRAAKLPDAAQADRVIAEFLVLQEDRLGADEIHFLRRAMCLTSELFGDLIGASRVEVSRWENGRVRMDAYHEFRLRMQVIEKLLPEQRRASARNAVSAVFSYRDMSKAKSSIDPIRVHERQLLPVHDKELVTA